MYQQVQVGPWNGIIYYDIFNGNIWNIIYGLKAFADTSVQNARLRKQLLKKKKF